MCLYPRASKNRSLLNLSPTSKVRYSAINITDSFGEIMATKKTSTGQTVSTRNAPPTGGVVTFLQTSDLTFDPDNPRFYRLNNPGSVAEVIEEMLDQEGVQDLMLSIGQKGYFAGEPLLVVSKTGTAPFIVVEGNRRLAAVKLLSGELKPTDRRRKSISIIQDEALETSFPEGLPCLIYTERSEVLRYLGYRHITGIKEWDALSKAKYLSELQTAFYPDLDLSDQLKALAKDIGSRSDYVGQLLTALELYTRAESTKRFFGLPIGPADVEFSYITTALNYSNICKWLGLNNKIDVAMDGINLENLKRAFGWFFSKDALGRTVLGESRNLAELASIVTSKSAVKVLEKTGDLSEAYLYTDGPQQALETAMQQAQDRIMTVWRMVPSTDQITSTHLNLAEKMAEDTRLIRNTLRDKVEDKANVRGT